MCHNISVLGTDDQRKLLISMFKQGSSLVYNKGEFIIRPGETPSSIYYICEGQVKAFNITKYGDENLLIIRKPHEIFPLIWAITGNGRNVIYQALAETKVYRIPRNDFTLFLKGNPSALYPFIDLVAEQYRIQSDRILDLEYRSVRERLASFLLTMAKRFGKKTSDGILIDVPLIQQDIASSINSSRETTGRELGVLERKKLITVEQSLILITDKSGLKKLL